MQSFEAIHILAVDNDEFALRGISRHLELEGYGVLTARNGEDAIGLTRECDPALILLDVIMPGIDGFETCRRIRDFSFIPILMLTGMNDPRDRVRGLNIGADDYMPKPFTHDELIARVRALLRRSNGARSMDITGVETYGHIVLDTIRRSVTVDKARVELTPMEFRLLLTLARNAERVVGHRELLGTAWGPGYRDDVEHLRVCIRRLRTKIEPDPSEPKYLRTARRMGYIFSSRDS